MVYTVLFFKHPPVPQDDDFKELLDLFGDLDSFPH
jgi:hypothetical protein